MTPTINEWEFTGDVVVWFSDILAEGGFPFSAAKTEQQTQGSAKRRDVTLLDRKGNAVITGEIKLPDRKDGASPFNDTVVRDARAKAVRAKVRYFFTWNVNTCVLWETARSEGPLASRTYETWQVASLRRSAELTQTTVQDTIKQWLRVFLRDAAEILQDGHGIGQASPDQKFMDALESALDAPIRFTLDALTVLHGQTSCKKDLDAWMRGDQGWTISTDPSGVQDNLDRAARFACYSLVNKLVFYEALLKRYGRQLTKITVPEHIDSGDDLRRHLAAFFADAMRVTGDYETVFGEDARSVGTRIPFYADGAVPHWADLINSIHEFDFSRMDYEVIGNIFERLIAPEERRKYGQFYTRVEVVDIMNAFPIRTGEETVMDPACGGGTYLVRAYVRKRELAPGRGHSALLTDLYGVDQSAFATHLTTINLATRDLIDDENYPQVARSDFFDIVPQKTFLSLPKSVKSRGLGASQHRQVMIAPLDAIVANPPYVRQEEIPKGAGGKKKLSRGTKEFYRDLVAHESGVKLSGRSDLHCYFWPHATTFLKPDGWLCFLTSSQWMDVEYGFRLQQWILENFEIVAIMESLDEPWFVGARVATTATILRRQSDPTKRTTNPVRFVQFRKPVRDLVAHDGTTGGAVAAVDILRDEILSLTSDVATDRYRCRIVYQGQLWDDGVRLGQVLKGAVTAAAAGADGSDDPGDAAVSDSVADFLPGSYFGGKWGVHVRAPDLWFKLLKTYVAKLAPLADIATVRRGITTGKDEFFFPRDRSQACLEGQPDARAFQLEYGVARKDVATGKVRLVVAGNKGEAVMPVESEYLEPEVHSLMEINGFVARPEDCSRMILLVGADKKKLKGTHVLDYIMWGEDQNYHTGATCVARASQGGGWYDLTGQARGALFWPKAQQYKHAIPLNAFDLQCNCNLYDVHLPDDVDGEVMAGILNSSIVVLSKFQYGRPVGVEGMLKTEVVDVSMMLVPDPRGADARILERIKTAFQTLKKRDALQFLSERRMRRMAYGARGKTAELAALPDVSELDMIDRHELDDAVLELLGASNAADRLAIRTALYGHLAEFFEATRRKEEEAIGNKSTARRKGAARPTDLASEIAGEIAERHKRVLRTYEDDFLDASLAYDTYELPATGEPEAVQTLFVPHGVTFTAGKKSEMVTLKTAAQVPLLVLLAQNGSRGYVRVPRQQDECNRILREYGAHVKRRDEVVTRLIEERTNDEQVQEAIRTVLMPMLARGARGARASS
jgi:N-6 DNA Methylase